MSTREVHEFKHISFRVTGFRKALASISAICDRNQKALFDNDGCYIQDKRSGQCTPFEYENDAYHLNVQIPKPQLQSECEPLAPVVDQISKGWPHSRRKP